MDKMNDGASKLPRAINLRSVITRLTHRRSENSTVIFTQFSHSREKIPARRARKDVTRRELRHTSNRFSNAWLGLADGRDGRGGGGESISLCTQVMSLFKELPFCWPTANYFPISGTARQSCFVKGRVSWLRETSSSVYISLSIRGTRHASKRMAFAYGAPYIRYGVKVRQAGKESSPLFDGLIADLVGAARSDDQT